MQENSIIKNLQVQYPIIQAPMLGVSTPEMAAAVSNAGGLGSAAAGGLSPEKTRLLIQQVKNRTEKPFALNLFTHEIPVIEEDSLNSMRELLRSFAKTKGYTLTDEDLKIPPLYSYKDQIDVIINEKVRIVSFTFGCPDTESIRWLKENGVLLIGTATSLEEAIFLQNQDIDMVVAQGIEAGGHRGSFMEKQQLPQTELLTLIAQFKDVITRPVIAAGGITRSEKVKELLTAGADGLQAGTAFIATQESSAIPAYKNLLEKSAGKDTSLTRSFSGRWARGIRNAFSDAIEAAGISIPPYPYQNSLMATLKKMAQENNDAGCTSLWSGTALPLINPPSTATAVFQQLVSWYRESTV